VILITQAIQINSTKYGRAAWETRFNRRAKKDRPMENREYFRVQDAMPVVTRKVAKEEEQYGIRSRIMPGFSIYQYAEAPAFEGEASTDPKLMNLLVEINTKLNLILQKLNIDSEGLNKAENKKVDLSEGGIRLNSRIKYDVGDLIEVKLLLSSLPYIGMILYGHVSRVKDVNAKEYEIVIVFLELEDDVREMLWKYLLDRQRGILRRQVDKED
jgi:hypothetical protein